MNPMQISADPAWHRWVDGAVILSVGVVIGLITAYATMVYEVETVTTTKIVRPIPMIEETEQGVVEAPAVPAPKSKSPKIQEI